MRSNKIGKVANVAMLIGQRITISKSNYSQVTGKVIKVSEQKIALDFGNGISGVENNVWITIQDENGKEHLGIYL